MAKILVWDPTGEIPEGEILEGANKIAAVERRGGVVLPFDPKLATNNAVAGYFRRSWGSGIHFDRMIGLRACPMMIYAVPDFPSFHWAARIMPIEGAKETKGIFRCTNNSGQVGTLTGGLGAMGEPIELNDTPPDKFGGWTIRGSNRLNCTLEGYLGLSIYATAVGARVMWSAVTQAAE